MQVVMLHYHLNRGGVTSVIENHLRALASLDAGDQPARVAVVYGGRAGEWNEQVADEVPFEVSLVAVPELDYDHLRSHERPLCESLNEVLKEFDPATTIVHIHNHSLGKNAEMVSVCGRLAAVGWRLLLQIHDFAEDLRPANYQHLVEQLGSADSLHAELYPQAEQIFYAVLNRRDYGVLASAGISERRLKLLPNPVKPPDVTTDDDEIKLGRTELAESLGLPADHRIVLYPVRAIRRKNLGEILLWSLLLDDATLVVTLAPLNPQELSVYQRWVEFAEELELPVVFDSGGKTSLPFAAVYASADAIITTSVAEGFGMVYLEASLVGQPLVGRNLPGVCQDFVDSGMEFPGLSEEMSLPAAECDLPALEKSHTRLLHDLRTAYGLPELTAAELPTTEVFSGDTIDFGRLESTQQRAFLRRVKAEPRLRESLKSLNPQVRAIDEIAPADLERTLKNNRAVIAGSFSLEVIGKQLLGLYQEVLASVPGSVECDPATASAVLDCFVHPDQLFPIRLDS